MPASSADTWPSTSPRIRSHRRRPPDGLADHGADRPRGRGLRVPRADPAARARDGRVRRPRRPSGEDPQPVASASQGRPRVRSSAVHRVDRRDGSAASARSRRPSLASKLPTSVSTDRLTGDVLPVGGHVDRAMIAATARARYMADSNRRVRYPGGANSSRATLPGSRNDGPDRVGNLRYGRLHDRVPVDHPHRRRLPHRCRSRCRHARPAPEPQAGRDQHTAESSSAWSSWRAPRLLLS
jgi:hypothetical protein